MNHALSLKLELLEQAAWGYRFRLTAHNDSTVKLYLPHPRVTALNFGDQTTRQVAEWSVHIFMHLERKATILGPGESWSVELRVRPCSVRPPEQWLREGPDWDYERCCVTLEQGEYLLWYQWRVEEDFFDSDSLMNFGDLEEAAKQEGAVMWRGQVLSNRLVLYHVDPRIVSRESEM